VYDVTAIEGGEGWAIQRVGTFVVGVFDVPLTRERIVACRRLYRAAVGKHGRLSVFAVFRSITFPLDPVEGKGAVSACVSVLEEFGSKFDVVVAVIDAAGFTGALARAGAATVTRLLAREIPVVYPGTIDRGIELAHERQAFHVVDEPTLRAQLKLLDLGVRRPAKAG